MSSTYRRLKDGKRCKKDYDFPDWKYHSDSLPPGFGFENLFCFPNVESPRELRSRVSRELARWKKYDNEVIISRVKQWWDWC